MRERFGTPDAFFRDYFIANYCPLVFMEDSGRNRTPDKLPPAERARLFDACDEALRAIVRTLQPQVIVGIGAFAERRAREALPAFDGVIGGMLHPSPASPLANRGWSAQADAALRRLGTPTPARAGECRTRAARRR